MQAHPIENVARPYRVARKPCRRNLCRCVEMHLWRLRIWQTL